MRRDSDSLCCQTHGWFTVEHGVDALGREWCDDGTCPECGEYPEAPIDPDDVTTAAPGLEDWISDNNPGCEVCCNEREDGESDVQFVLPADRQPAERHLRWKCPVHGWVDDKGRQITAEKQVAA